MSVHILYYRAKFLIVSDIYLTYIKTHHMYILTNKNIDSTIINHNTYSKITVNNFRKWALHIYTYMYSLKVKKFNI